MSKPPPACLHLGMVAMVALLDLGQWNTVRVPPTLRVDRQAHRAWVGNTLLRLTRTELELLAQLSSSPGRAFTRMELLRAVWATDHAGYARNVDCHVTRVRRKIEAAGLVPAPIEGVRGVGYRYVG